MQPHFLDDEPQTRPRRADESGEHLKSDRIQPGDEDITLDSMPVNPRYDFASMLGEGGMGEVRLCVDRRVQRPVAMKSLRPERANHPVERVRFVREAMAQAQLEHPAIVPVYDFGTDERGALFFTMRRVEGFTLDEVVRGLRDRKTAFESEYTRHRLLSSFNRVCQAVHYAHTRNVFHCDLKPTNIMLGSFGEVYVLDWGIAETEAGGNLGGGTPGYMAPEQIRGEGVDARTDVYALGATLFEMLTLSSLHGGDAMEAARTTLHNAPVLPSHVAPEQDIAPELDAIVAKATALEPDDRYETVRELHDELERYLAGDRDHELRREMSRAHTDTAQAIVASLKLGADVTPAQRSEALRSVGRALAFDPENAAALRTLVELLTRGPAEMPPEAAEEMFAAERKFQKTRAIAGAFGFFAWVALLPIFFVMGVGQTWAMVANAVAWSAAGFALLNLARKPRSDGRSGLAMPILGATAISMTTFVFGSLSLTATFATVLSMGFTLAMPHRHRFVPMAVSCFAVLGPWAGVSLGLLPAGALAQTDLTRGSSSVLLASIVCIVVASVFGMKLRQTLTGVQQRAYLNSWQLRQLLPKVAVGATTD